MKTIALLVSLLFLGIGCLPNSSEKTEQTVSDRFNPPVIITPNKVVSKSSVAKDKEDDIDQIKKVELNKEISAEEQSPNTDNTLVYEGREYLVLQTVSNSSYGDFRAKLLVIDNKNNRDMIETQGVNSFRCFESIQSASVRLSDPLSIAVFGGNQELIRVVPFQAMKDLATDNSCVSIEKIESDAIVYLKYKQADGPGQNTSVYKYDLRTQNLELVYTYQTWTDDTALINPHGFAHFSAWSRWDTMFVQVKHTNDRYTSIYKIISDDAYNIPYSFKGIQLLDMAHQTDQATEVELFSSDNLQSSLRGLNFKIGSEKVFLTWD